MEDFPFIPADLLAALDAAFPERSPQVTDSIEQIRHQGGQRSVVRFLHQRAEEQRENVLNQRVTAHV